MKAQKSKHMSSFFSSFKKLKKKHEFHFFVSLKKLKKHWFNFLQSQRSSKNMNFIFFVCLQAWKCSKTCIKYFVSWKSSKYELDILKKNNAKQLNLMNKHVQTSWYVHFLDVVFLTARYHIILNILNVLQCVKKISHIIIKFEKCFLMAVIRRQEKKLFYNYHLLYQVFLRQFSRVGQFSKLLN